MHLRHPQRYRQIFLHPLRPGGLPAQGPPIGIQSHRRARFRHHSKFVDVSSRNRHAVHHAGRRSSSRRPSRRLGKEHFQFDVSAVQPLDAIIVTVLQDLLPLLDRHIRIRGTRRGHGPHGSHCGGFLAVRQGSSEDGRGSHPIGSLAARQCFGFEGHLEGEAADRGGDAGAVVFAQRGREGVRREGIDGPSGGAGGNGRDVGVDGDVAHGAHEGVVVSGFGGHAFAD
mmetsp:Transcript_14315/g.30057  ORF Transcript_14315/g.30057 Transcript_14315/m.30057 type:complete len:227 (+) Transcript_14315:477-1157(+)